MKVGSNKTSGLKTRTYNVPASSRRRYRWTAAALRTLQGWNRRVTSTDPVTLMVPAVYNVLPGENVAMGWLNEIDALAAIHHRMIAAAKVTGWDVFTFHTLHNLDPFFSSTIATVRDTWVNEGSLSMEAVQETRRQFRKPYDYFRVQPRLVENLVFQSSMLDWFAHRAGDTSMRLHVIGTALLSALVSTGAVALNAALESVLKFGARWDETICGMTGTAAEDASAWSRYEKIRGLTDGRSAISLAVPREDLPLVEAPSRPFWYSPSLKESPVLIATAREAAAALETLNLDSWSGASSESAALDLEPVRGWLVSPSHPLARICRWSLSNFLVATPATATLFLDHIATMAPVPLPAEPSPAFQNRFRLSRMKVTGP